MQHDINKLWALFISIVFACLRITLVWWTLLHTQAHAHTYVPLDHELWSFTLYCPNLCQVCRWEWLKGTCPRREYQAYVIPVRFSKQRIETKELKCLKSTTLLRLAMQMPFLSLRGFHGSSGECNMAVSWTLSTKASLKSHCPENSQRWGAFVFDGTALHSPRQFEWSLISINTRQHGVYSTEFWHVWLFWPIQTSCTTRETPLDRSERKQPSRQPTATAKLQPTVVWPFGAAAMAKKSKASKGSSGKKPSGDGGRFVVSLLHTEVVGAQRSSGHLMFARFLYLDFMTHTSAHVYIYRKINTSENRRVEATLFPHFCGIISMTSILTLRVWCWDYLVVSHSFQHLLDRSLRREEAKERQW